MRLITDTLTKIQQFIRLLGTLIIFLMMLFITLNVFLRIFGNPLLGNVEVVKLMMVAIIMFGLTYSEFEKAHIYVEILYERFASSVQRVLLIITYLIGAAVTLFISYTFFKLAINTFKAGVKQTTLLEIPIYPFEFLIGITFFIWFLQMIVHMFNITEREIGGEVKDGG